MRRFRISRKTKPDMRTDRVGATEISLRHLFVDDSQGLVIRPEATREIGSAKNGNPKRLEKL